ncbi:DUF2877 domain-containing protein [Paenibacillus fonticola]|uniref:DUF2877 domain-containing protein n=1 Tax=Paenibacillus fonticola TaxID=379896 RepID=UPI000379263E|nr:DUF2877 domain-containing protein [Paenibacillus fonticola]
MAYTSQAKSGDSRFIELIQQGHFCGKVHSVFNRTFNIQSADQGELFTIASESLDNGPNTLVTDLAHFSKIQLSVHDRIEAMNNKLYVLNKIEIGFDHVKKWDSILPPFPFNEQQWRRHLSTARDVIEQHGTGGGMKYPIASSNSFGVEVWRLLSERSGLLENALLEGRIGQAIQEAVRLIGLGFGLTPSGDDYLVGLFAVINMPHGPFYEHRALCSEIVNAASGQTNEISYITLKKASTGEVRESLIRLLRDLTGGSEAAMVRSLQSVLNIGSTSGTDLATGIVSGLELSAEKSWR